MCVWCHCPHGIATPGSPGTKLRVECNRELSFDSPRTRFIPKIPPIFLAAFKKFFMELEMTEFETNRPRNQELPSGQDRIGAFNNCQLGWTSP